MLFETITWKDEVIHICISEFRNSTHLDRDKLLNLASSMSELVLAVQFFNGAMIVDELHLLSAAQNALNAWRGDYMRSRSLDVEIVIYASAQHQIGRALELMGVSDKTVTVAVVALGDDEQKVQTSVLDLEQAIGNEISPAFEMTVEKLKTLMAAFHISESEILLFLDKDDIPSRQLALSKCLVSRISQVATIS
ncbi:MAG: KEOPS complex subunit Cgi121 [Candidatus Thorarchaeota archaeon]|nr:KEOPS complex subunit Cgi121 [Candidatus Thorarchaeota archaeon]